jgi:hypothetical protein
VGENVVDAVQILLEDVGLHLYQEEELVPLLGSSSVEKCIVLDILGLLLQELSILVGRGTLCHQYKQFHSLPPIMRNDMFGTGLATLSLLSEE